MTRTEPEFLPPSVTLVTGTSSGIGLEIAVQAAVAGHTVIATMRDTARDGRLRAAAADAGVELDIRQLDVTDPVSIDACIDSVVDDYGRLNALVNNAGVGHVGTIERETVDDVRAVFETNFFGVVATTRAALPHLRSAKGRIVTISSVGGVVGQPYNEAYCAAKFAVEGFMESLAPVVGSLGVRVSVVEPGAVQSDFVTNAGVDPEAMLAAAEEYRPSLEAYLTRTLALFAGNMAQSPKEAVAPIIEVLTAEEPAARVQTSGWAADFVSPKLNDRDGSRVLAETSGWVLPAS